MNYIKAFTAILLTMTCFTSLAYSAEQTDPFYFDFGLYWHGVDEQMARHSAGQSNPFYDPSKPTVIYFHGWQPNHAKNGYDKASLHLQHEGIDVYTQNSWIEQGWNVGIFHWEQWSDENSYESAEAKIWTVSGPEGMRVSVLQPDGNVTYEKLSNPDWNRPISVLAADHIIDAMADYNGNNIRFVGFSLGSQLATATAKIIHERVMSGQLDEDTYRLQRLALLEPSWTQDGKNWWPGTNDLNEDGADDWTGERSRWAIFDLMDSWTDSHNFVVEIYNTTPLDTDLFGLMMDNNTPLRERVMGTARVSPWYYDLWEIGARHNVANRHYFWSMAFHAPPECITNWWTRRETGNLGPSAATPEWRVKEMMGNTNYWIQVEGRHTETPGDDLFEVKHW